MGTPPPLFTPRGRQHDLFLAIDLHGITCPQLASTAGLDGAIHPHIPPLDALLGLPTGTHEALPFEKLLQFHREERPGQR